MAKIEVDVYNTLRMLMMRRDMNVKLHITGNVGGGGGESIETPVIQSSSLAITDIEDDNQTLSVSRGDGDFILVLRSDSSISFTPTDDVTYTDGQEVTMGVFVAYIGTSTSFNEASLSADTVYYYTSFEFNRSGSSTRYLTTSAPTVNDRTFTTEYQEVIDLAILQNYSPPATLAGKKADNELIREAKSIGLFSVAPRFFNHHTTGDSDYACIDYINRSVGTIATKNNSPTFVVKEGFTGNTVAFIDYNWVPSDDLILTQNDFGIIAYSGINVQSNSLFGCRNSTTGDLLTLIPRNTSDQTRYFINTTTDRTISGTTDSSGLYVLRRTASNSQRIVKNGTVIDTVANTSTGIPNASLIGLGYRNGTVGVTSLSNSRIDCMIPFKQSIVSDADIKTMWDNHRTRTAAV